MGETFGEALRRLRGNRSVRDVANLAACGKSHVSDLENGRRKVTPRVAASLDRALGAGGELVALAEAGPGMGPLERADALQRGVQVTLAAGAMTEAGTEDWEYTVSRHGRATRYRAECTLLPELLDDFSDLRVLLTRRHPAPVRRRLVSAAARMSGLVALTLLKLDDRRSRAWWRTGRAAAAAAQQRETFSWVYAQEAYQAFYDRDVHGALAFASRARELAGGLPCVGPALAASLAARAHAVLGRRDEAIAALHDAEMSLGRLDAADRVGSAFGYSEEQFRFHAGNAWTLLKDTRRASEQQDQALALYAEDEHTDRALVHLDRAACLALNGEAAAAAAHASGEVLDLPVEHRSALIVRRARDVLALLPESREVPETQRLREVLDQPA